MAQPLLLVAKEPNAAAKICTCLTKAGYQVTVHADPLEIQDRALGEEFALAVFLAPEENARALGLNLVSCTGTAVLFLGSFPEEVTNRYRDKGIMLLSLPLNRSLLLDGIGLALSARRRLLTLAAENEKLQRSLTKTKLIDKAKFALMQTLGMTEEQAHKYLEQQAMDMHLPKETVAKQVLSAYEV